MRDAWPTAQQIRKTFTGKTGGRNDDLCIALQLALAGARQFYQSGRYNTFRPENARAEVSITGIPSDLRRVAT